MKQSSLSCANMSASMCSCSDRKWRTLHHVASTLVSVSTLSRTTARHSSSMRVHCSSSTRALSRDQATTSFITLSCLELRRRSEWKYCE